MVTSVTACDDRFDPLGDSLSKTKHLIFNRFL